jgi:hypothetical protein
MDSILSASEFIFSAWAAESLRKADSEIPSQITKPTRAIRTTNKMVSDIAFPLKDRMIFGQDKQDGYFY